MDTIGKKLGLKEKMAYGCGDAASNIIWASTGTFLMFYYTDVVNINAATIGVIFLIARVINAVVALLTGWLMTIHILNMERQGLGFYGLQFHLES